MQIRKKSHFNCKWIRFVSSKKRPLFGNFLRFRCRDYPVIWNDVTRFYAFWNDVKLNGSCKQRDTAVKKWCLMYTMIRRRFSCCPIENLLDRQQAYSRRPIPATCSHRWTLVSWVRRHLRCSVCRSLQIQALRLKTWWKTEINK